MTKQAPSLALALALWLAAVPAQAQYEFAQQGSGISPAPAPQQTAPADPRQRAKIHTELGALYFQAGNMAVALDELRIALDADKTYVQAYSVRGLVHAALKQYDKAEADFQRALDRAPDDPEVNNNYGWFLCDIGKEARSITYFMKALKNPLYETPGRAYTNAGTCALKAGDIDAAQDYLLKAIQVANDGALLARFKLAQLLYMRGNLPESRLYLADALRMMEPPTAEALWLGIRLERRLGNRVAEGSYAAQLRSRYPASAEYQDFLKGRFE
ncbi:MAG: type IV pilus biogenesis/stability protein PilW [Dechloromonas sp.]|nr:type IV pilus biogenesis/stability protein PilW [Dechloromonas sp.]